uniref:vomeronasal type-1 receptor 4-like n=1 Tax=Jaculus jaculus TaxID=51337 RepID=UPI001E1B31E8|nr:vomeronasal type-1 receptor 4-like [Jaculus jaculus]
MATIFLSQLTLGILGNSVLLYHFIRADFIGDRAKPTDLIVKHLTWANLIVILFKGIPQTIMAFGLISFLDDIFCKVVSYFNRIARGVSLSSTSLLSVIQAITISPSNSRLVQLKVRAFKVIGPALGLCWALHMLVNFFIPMKVTNILDARNHTRFADSVNCAVVGPPSQIQIVYSVLLSSIDVICLGFIMWASGFMVLMLWKHKQRVQHIHSALCPSSSPETRATQSILALVSSFVLFYVTSVILNLCFPYFHIASKWLINANGAMTACFPAFCPFLLIRQYATVPMFCCKSKANHGPCLNREL